MGTRNINLSSCMTGIEKIDRGKIHASLQSHYQPLSGCCMRDTYQLVARSSAKQMNAGTHSSLLSSSLLCFSLNASFCELWHSACSAGQAAPGHDFKHMKKPKNTQRISQLLESQKYFRITWNNIQICVLL